MAIAVSYRNRAGKLLETSCLFVLSWRRYMRFEQNVKQRSSLGV